MSFGLLFSLALTIEMIITATLVVLASFSCQAFQSRVGDSSVAMIAANGVAGFAGYGATLIVPIFSALPQVSWSLFSWRLQSPSSAI
jgi:hypothetical protein